MISNRYLTSFFKIVLTISLAASVLSISACGGASSSSEEVKDPDPKPPLQVDYPVNGVFSSNAQLSGPGGNANAHWVYGGDRPKIEIYRDVEKGICYLDNGWVAVIDMNDEQDSTSSPVPVDDSAYPAFSFECDENPVNNARPIMDYDDPTKVWTYSALNDAMYYGTEAAKVLRDISPTHTPEKIRIRAHHGSIGHFPNAYWDGGYVNFREGAEGIFKSLVSQDIVAHEIGHAMLNALAPSMNHFDFETTFAAKIAHEAFSDIMGFVVKYKINGSKQWQRGEESQFFERDLDKIITEKGAIESALDIDDAGDNRYLAINTLTYPFYLMVEKWGVEDAHKIYLLAATQCWQGTHEIKELAECIAMTAFDQGKPKEDIIAAFLPVKIDLRVEGVLAHFEYQKFKLRTIFLDDSRATGDSYSLTNWLWRFGDGQTSTLQHPQHTYAAAGEYTVELIASDSSIADESRSNSMTRVVSVTDQYCAPNNVTNLGAAINSVTINGASINFDKEKYDYTATAINVADKANVMLDVQGDRNGEPWAFTWKAWLDVNDNGLYEESELIKNEDTAADQNYAWSGSLDVSAIAAGETRYLRMSGRYVNIGPCDPAVGEVFDIRLTAPAID